MSAKRSFDVRASARAPKPSPAVRRRGVSRKPLKARRRESQQRTGLITLVIALVVVGGFIYLLWRPEVRIATVEASGVLDPASFEAITKNELSGTYWHIFPRDSFFLYPERSIRAAILEAHPDVSALSISRTGFTSLHLEGSSRSAAFRWCGRSAALSGSCYEADAEGFVFALSPTENATTSPLLRVYGELDSEIPLKAHVVGAEHVPDALRFVRAIQSLGTPIPTIELRGDEADLYASSGTRITYVIGHEEEAAKSAGASLPRLNLMDGSIEYVDLRFDGKVYFKRAGE